MLLTLAPGWTLELDRGPDWLFVSLRGEHPHETESVEFAERVWELMQQHFTSRLVLELNRVSLLHSHFVGELLRLHKRVVSQDGLLRLSGLSDSNQEVLRTLRVAERFPQYRSREEAVMGHRPSQPR